MLHPTAEFRKTLPAAPGGSSTRSTRIQASLSHTASGPVGYLRCFRRPTNEIRTCPDLLHLDLTRQLLKILPGLRVWVSEHGRPAQLSSHRRQDLSGPSCYRLAVHHNQIAAWTQPIPGSVQGFAVLRDEAVTEAE